MTIHFFTFSDEISGSSRQRAFRVAEELRALGFTAVIHWPSVLLISKTRWPKKFLLIMQTIRSLFLIKKGDIVFLQRAISNKYFFVIMVVYLFLFRRKMIFDFDDPVYVHSFFKTKVFTQMADAVVVCTHGQAQWAKQYNSNVHIIHISLKFSAYEKYTKDYRASTPPYIIGWVGTAPEHIHNLKILASVFKKLLVETNISFKFVLIGALKNKEVYDLFQNIPSLTVQFIDALNWKDPESVPREIQKFDIGVLPHRSDGEWNKAKSSFKILEYMACGVATICSAFGEMPYIIKDGINGYIAASEEEWVDKLKKFLAERDLREKLGKGGQARVREEYCFEATIPRIIEIIRALP